MAQTDQPFTAYELYADDLDEVDPGQLAESFGEWLRDEVEADVEFIERRR